MTRRESMRRLPWQLMLALLVSACAGNGTPVRTDRGGNAPDQPLSPFTGWYLLERDRPVLVTWAADGGLRMFAFGDRPLAARLAPDAGLAFRWIVPDADAPRPVTFRAGAGGAITGFDWAAADGARHHAAALPDQGYRPRELSFSHAGVLLSGTLFVPSSGGPHPLAVLIHGSGTSDRDNFWPPAPGAAKAPGRGSIRLHVVRPEAREAVGAAGNPASGRVLFRLTRRGRGTRLLP